MTNMTHEKLFILGIGFVKSHIKRVFVNPLNHTLVCQGRFPGLKFNPSPGRRSSSYNDCEFYYNCISLSLLVICLYASQCKACCVCINVSYHYTYKKLVGVFLHVNNLIWILYLRFLQPVKRTRTLKYRPTSHSLGRFTMHWFLPKGFRFQTRHLV